MESGYMIFLKQFESESLQLSLFVVSSIFVGFSTTVLAIFSVLSSNKMVVKVAQTSVMLEKINRFAKGLKCMAVSMINFHTANLRPTKSLGVREPRVWLSETKRKTPECSGVSFF